MVIANGSKLLKSGLIATTLLFAWGLASVNVYAASDEIKTDGTTQTEDQQDMERIEVRGKFDPSRAYFQRQIETTELSFFERFNELADERKFKMNCRNEKTTGTRIKRKVCYPQYALDRMNEETQKARRTGAPFPTMEFIQRLTKKEQEESYAYTEKVIKENPDLAKLFVAMVKAQQALKKYDEEN